jgi:quercetin dioxygenase-like cupin family protein
MPPEVTADEPGRHVAILVATSAVCLTESVFAVGRPGTDPHLHRRHTDVFHVLEGVLTFGLGREWERRDIPAGTTVIVPAGVVHGFQMEHSPGARFLNVHAPNIGYDDYLRTPGAAMADLHDAPDGGGPPASAAVVSTESLVAAWREWSAATGADPAGEVAETLTAVLAAHAQP